MSNIFYLFFHIFSQSHHSLLHPSRVAAAAAAHCRSSLRLATSVRPWSWLRFPFSSCCFSPNRFFFAWRGTTCAFPAQRCTVRAQRNAWRLAAQRAHSLCCPVLPCSALNRAVRGMRMAAPAPRVPAPLGLSQHPAQALLPTTCTAPARHAALLLLCCHRRLPNAHRSPRAGRNHPW